MQKRWRMCYPDSPRLAPPPPPEPSQSTESGNDEVEWVGSSAPAGSKKGLARLQREARERDAASFQFDLA